MYADGDDLKSSYSFNTNCIVCVMAHGCVLKCCGCQAWLSTSHTFISTAFSHQRISLHSTWSSWGDGLVLHYRLKSLFLSHHFFSLRNEISRPSVSGMRYLDLFRTNNHTSWMVDWHNLREFVVYKHTMSIHHSMHYVIHDDNWHFDGLILHVSFFKFFKLPSESDYICISNMIMNPLSRTARIS